MKNALLFRPQSDDRRHTPQYVSFHAPTAVRVRRMNNARAARPKGTARIFFVFDLWPVLLIFLVGPIGNYISSGSWGGGQQYRLLLAIDVFVYIAFCITAALWAYQPLALILKHWRPGMISHSSLLEQNIAELPLRVAKSFAISGTLFATYILLMMLFGRPALASNLPLNLIAALALSLYFAFTVVSTALAVGRSLIYTMRLRKKMSHLGLCCSSVDTRKGQRITLSITTRPWLLFVITSVVPILLMGLFFFLGRNIDNARHEQFIVAQMSVLFFGVLIVGSYLVHTLRRSLQLVTNELRQGVVAIQEGDFRTRVAVLTDDETGEMAASLNTALGGLQERDDLKDALAIAAEIQSGLFPKQWPSLPGYELNAYQKSCLEVGGDFYDYIERSDGRIWLIVADVAGKGYPAALTVSNLHATLHAVASSAQHFDHIAGYINQALYNTLTRGQFVTLFMAELDPREGSLSWFSAGHTPAVLASRTGGQLLEASGPPLGMLPEVKVETRTCMLAAGDVMAIFTDGVTEMRASRDSNEQFGIQRAVDWFQKYSGGDLEEVIKNFLDDLGKFGELAKNDDLTLLLLRHL